MLTMFLYYEHGKTVEWVAILVFKKQKLSINFPSLYVILRFSPFHLLSPCGSFENYFYHSHFFPAFESLGLHQCCVSPYKSLCKNCAMTEVHSTYALSCQEPFLSMMA